MHPKLQNTLSIKIHYQIVLHLDQDLEIAWIITISKEMSEILSREWPDLRAMLCRASC